MASVPAWRPLCCTAMLKQHAWSLLPNSQSRPLLRQAFSTKPSTSVVPLHSWNPTDLSTPMKTDSWPWPDRRVTVSDMGNRVRSCTRQHNHTHSTALAGQQCMLTSHTAPQHAPVRAGTCCVCFVLQPATVPTFFSATTLRSELRILALPVVR